MAIIVIEDDWDPTALDIEDGGQARIYSMDYKPEDTNGLFVRLQSWDETKCHKLFEMFQGKRIRITVESIE